MQNPIAPGRPDAAQGRDLDNALAAPGLCPACTLLWIAGVGRSFWWVGVLVLSGGSLLRLASPRAEPVGILFLGSTPQDVTPLQLDEEARSIDRALHAGSCRDDFKFIQHGAVRFKDIPGLLMRYDPAVVHFSGHGDEQGDLILKSGPSGSQPASPEDLAELFRAVPGVSCVILNACYSAERARAILQRVDCVVGMSQTIPDRDAISFSEAFYEAISYGKGVRTAFDLGCATLGGSSPAPPRGRRPRAGLDPSKLRVPVLLFGDGKEDADIVLAHRANRQRRFAGRGVRSGRSGHG